jgi:hypothetical protein
MKMDSVQQSLLKEMFCNMEKKNIKNGRYAFDFLRVTDKGQVRVRLFKSPWCVRGGRSLKYKFRKNWAMNSVGLYAAGVELLTSWNILMKQDVCHESADFMDTSKTQSRCSAK